MGHDRRDVPPSAAPQERLERRQLRGERGHRSPIAGAPQPLAEELIHLVELAPAQVAPFLADDHVVRAATRQLPEAAQDLVGPVARGAQRETNPARAARVVVRPACARQGAADVQQTCQPRLVVGKVDQGQDTVALVEVHAARVRVRVLGEGPQAIADRGRRKPQGVGGSRGGQGVGHVVA